MKKTEDKKIKLGFTTIQHDPRLRFKLSNNEYCIADSIYYLSHNPQGAVLGWCYASRQTLGCFFGISRQSVITIVKRLQQKGLVEVNMKTSYMRTTQLWYQNFVLFEVPKRKA